MNRDNNTIKQVLQWFATGDVGSSSETIVYALMGVEDFRITTPGDWSDFNRCYQLLKDIPELNNRKHELANLSNEWKNIINNWEHLVFLYKRDDNSFYKELYKIKEVGNEN